jgi:hypothetical protein
MPASGSNGFRCTIENFAAVLATESSAKAPSTRLRHSSWDTTSLKGSSALLRVVL